MFTRSYQHRPYGHRISSETLSTFKLKIKTHLFSVSFPRASDSLFILYTC